MSNLEIGLIVIVVLLIGLAVFYFKHAVKSVVECNNHRKLYNSCSDDLSVVSDELIDVNRELTERCKSVSNLTEQLKQIKDLREARKKKILIVGLKSDGKIIEEEHVEGTACDYEEDIQMYLLKNSLGGIIASFPRENVGFIKRELVDIENCEKEK